MWYNLYLYKRDSISLLSISVFIDYKTKKVVRRRGVTSKQSFYVDAALPQNIGPYVDAALLENKGWYVDAVLPHNKEFCVDNVYPQNKRPYIDGALPQNKGSCVDGALPQNKRSYVDGALPQNKGSYVDKALPQKHTLVSCIHLKNQGIILFCFYQEVIVKLNKISYTG